MVIFLSCCEKPWPHQLVVLNIPFASVFIYTNLSHLISVLSQSLYIYMIPLAGGCQDERAHHMPQEKESETEPSHQLYVGIFPPLPLFVYTGFLAFLSFSTFSPTFLFIHFFFIIFLFQQVNRPHLPHKCVVGVQVPLRV